MPTPQRPILIATRGSALALAQAHAVLDQCRHAFPELRFEIKEIKTTGDKLQTASLAQPAPDLPKGLFTKELEVALLKHEADLAVHSLKDLPTELPEGLALGAVGRRADARDVLVYRDANSLRAAAAPGEGSPAQAERRGFASGLSLEQLPQGVRVGTSSTRRRAQLLACRPDLRISEIRGNVITRLRKLAQQPELDAILLAAAGLERLHFAIEADSRLRGDAVPDGLLATRLDPGIMLPCAGQAALGIEVREGDERVQAICERLNDFNTQQCVAAERAFLRAMGGGCQSPVAAFAEATGDRLRLRVISFRHGPEQRAEGQGGLREAEALGRRLAQEITDQES